MCIDALRVGGMSEHRDQGAHGDKKTRFHPQHTRGLWQTAGKRAVVNRVRHTETKWLQPAND